MADLLVLGLIVLLVAAAVNHLIQERKKGVKCLGCPMAASCSRKKNGCK